MGTKRELSTEIYEPNYDFTLTYKSEIKTNLESISVQQEYESSKLVIKFHENYESKFKSLFQMRFAPKDSLNRFLYEQLSLSNRSNKQLITSPENILKLDTLDKEIKTAFPLTCKFKKSTPRWKLEKNLKDCIYIGNKYSYETKQFADNQYLKKLLKNQIKESNEDFYEKFLLERNNYSKMFETIIKDKIKEIKKFLFDELQKLVSKLDLISKTCSNETAQVLIDTSNKYCAEIKYRDTEFKLVKFHFDKLKTLFNLNKHKFSDSIKFEERVYCLMSRYQTFFRNNEMINEGYGMQAALPKKVFQALNIALNVKQEMFASPFNCYFRTYCSAFYDTDAYFGSVGSFFDFEPSEDGSFECNPPFTEEVIERMADRIDYLLTNSKFALSFIVFIPEWLDPPTPGLVKMEKSKFKQLHFNKADGEHEYVSGSQHVTADDLQLYTAVHNTRVFVLQNEVGSNLFSLDKEKIEELKASMNSKEDSSVNVSKKVKI